VKRSVDDIAVSPGPNIFSSGETNVFIDGNSDLHLKIMNPSGQWLCSELIADTSLGFGTYTFHLKSRVDNFDLHTILGIFTWDDISPYASVMPDDFYREYDFEFGYWSIPGNDAGQFVIQPWNNPGNIFRFPIGAEIHTIHRMTWKKDTVEFISMREDLSVISQFEYTGNDCKYPGTENIRINLWLNFGQSPAGVQEAILSGFDFENLLPAPQNVNATDGDPLKITVTWDDQPGKFFGVYRGLSDDPLEAELLTGEWISQSSYIDNNAEIGQTYYYRVRSGDNIAGSNTTGYASGYSDFDTGWAAGTNAVVQVVDRTGALIIFPNPCDESARVTAVKEAGDGHLRLYDPMGRQMLEQPFNTETSLSTSGLSPGIYFVQLVTRSGEAYSARLVVNH